MHTRGPQLGLALLVVAIALIALLGVSLTGTSWAAPGAQNGTVPQFPTPTKTPGGGGGFEDCTPNCPTPVVPPGVVCPIGDQAVVCTAAGKTITVPAGAVMTGTVLTIVGPLAQPPCPATPSGQVFLDHCFQVTWQGPNGLPVVFNAPVTDCLTFSASDVAVAGGQATNLLIGLVETPGTWTMIKPTVQGSQICANVDKVFSWQAMFAPQPTLLPVTGAGGGLDGVWLVVLAGVGALGGALLYRFNRKSNP